MGRGIAWDYEGSDLGGYHFTHPGGMTCQVTAESGGMIFIDSEGIRIRVFTSDQEPYASFRYDLMERRPSLIKHTCCPSHCCARHGCKYGYEDCPVCLGLDPGIRCESCDYEAEDRARDVIRLAGRIRFVRMRAVREAFRPNGFRSDETVTLHDGSDSVT